MAGGATRPARKRFILIGVVLAVLLGIGLFTVVLPGGREKGGPPVPGSMAPKFTIAKLGGGPRVGTPVSGGGGGRPQVLLFFASWCAPCRAEIPALAAAYTSAHLGDNGPSRLSVLGVDVSDPTASAQRFVSASKVSFPVGVDPSFAVTSGLYFFTGIPEAVEISGTGKILAIVHGPLSVKTFLSWAHDLTDT